MPKSKDKGKIHMKRKPEPSTADITVIDITDSPIDITDSPIIIKKLKYWKDESQDFYSGGGQSGSQDMFPSEDIFPSQDSALAEITDSPIKFKKLNIWKDESQDSYSGGGPSGSQIFPSQVVLESDPITTEEPVVTKKGDPYAYSNFQELHDLMVRIFKIVYKGPLETISEASRKFLHFCAVVVRTRNDELQEMMENAHPQQDISTSGDEESDPNE